MLRPSETQAARWAGPDSGLDPGSDRWPFSRAVLAAEDGNTMILYPFALLIVLALGGIALDTAVFFQAHREAVDVAAGLASDIAGIIDEESFAERGQIVIDPVRAQRLVNVTNNDLATHPNQLVCSHALSGNSVEVRCVGTGEAILLPVVGLLGDMTLDGRSTASAG